MYNKMREKERKKERKKNKRKMRDNKNKEEVKTKKESKKKMKQREKTKKKPFTVHSYTASFNKPFIIVFINTDEVENGEKKYRIYGQQASKNKGKDRDEYLICF